MWRPDTGLATCVRQGNSTMAKYGVLALACLLAAVSVASAQNVTLVRVHGRETSRPGNHTVAETLCCFGRAAATAWQLLCLLAAQGHMLP